MELFSLLAKLTLDKKEYDKGLKQAQNDAKDIDIPDPSIGLDTTEFDKEIGNIKDTHIEAPKDPAIGLDQGEFDTDVAAIPTTDIGDPDDPDIGLDQGEFDNAVEAIPQTDIEDPSDPEIDLDQSGFDSAVEEIPQTDIEDPADPAVGLDTKEFSDNIAAAEEEGKGFEGSMTSVFKGIKNALVATGIVAAVTKVVNGIKDAVNLTAETADGIEKGSKRLGISQKAYQEWDHALRQSGASINDVSKGIRNMQAVIVDGGASFKDLAEGAEEVAEASDDAADGVSKKVLKAYRDLGMESDIVNGKFASTESMMEATMLALAGFKGTTEERGTIVRALFGNNADGLNALLDEGVEGVKDLMDEASRLGLVMSDDEIKQAVEYGDAVDNLNDELVAIKTAFVQDIIPVLTDAVTWLTDFLAKLNPRTKTNTVFDLIDEIDEKTKNASRNVDSAQAEASELIKKLQEMGSYWTLDAEGKMTWDALADKALDLFPQLSEFIDRDGHIIRGNTEDIENNIKAWARLEKQRLLTAALEEKSKAVAEQLVEAYDKGAQAAVKQAEADSKLEEAVAQMNTALEDNDMLKTLLRVNFGTDVVTKENAGDLLAWIKKNGYDTKEMGAEAVDDWYKIQKEADELRTTADGMIEDAEKAQAELEDYQVRLGEEMGLTRDEILKTTRKVDQLDKSLRNLPKGTRIEVQYEEHENGFRHAIGSAYIPWDDYPALLHRGERIMTATEARQERESVGNIDLNALEERLIAAIRNGMENATVRSYIGEKEVTDIVSQQLANELNNRR